MIGLIAAFGVIFILIGVSVGLLALASLAFPSIKKVFPDDWQKWLSLQYTAYYLLAGGLCLLVSQQF